MPTFEDAYKFFGSPWTVPSIIATAIMFTGFGFIVWREVKHKNLPKE